MTTEAESAPGPGRCSICGALAAEESSFRKYGWPTEDVALPPAASQLVVVKDYRPHASRLLQLRQCPECGAYFRYRTDYTYLAGGSEDEEYLERLTPTEAAEYLARPAPE